MKVRRSLRGRFATMLRQLGLLKERRAGLGAKSRSLIVKRVLAYTGWKVGTEWEILAKASAKLADWEIVALVAPVNAEIGAEEARTKSEINWIEFSLDRMARTLTPEAGDTWIVVETVWCSTYRSQGLSSRTYSVGMAEVVASAMRGRGVVVRTDSDSEPDRVTVEVQVRDRVDAEILKRGQSMTIRDFLKACWSRALNPRVFNPWLPHGLEEKLGIDYQGRDVPRKGTP